MKKLAAVMLAAAVFGLIPNQASAQQEGGEDRPRESERQEREGDRGPRDGDRERREGDRGPRDGDRERREGDRGPRDGDRGPRDGDRGPRGDFQRDDRFLDRDDRGRPNGPILSALDRNRNGILESEEIDQAIVVLRRMDRNRDGRLSPDELGGRPGPEGDRPRGTDPRRGEGRFGPEQAMARFNEADTDKDGKLSKEEAPERMRQGFDRIDANNNGFVEKEEFESMIRRMMQGGRGRPPRDGEGRGPEGRDRPPRDGERPPRDGERPPRDGDRDGERPPERRRPDAE